MALSKDNGILIVGQSMAFSPKRIWSSLAQSRRKPNRALALNRALLNRGLALNRALALAVQQMRTSYGRLRVVSREHLSVSRKLERRKKREPEGRRRPSRLHQSRRPGSLPGRHQRPRLRQRQELPPEPTRRIMTILTTRNCSQKLKSYKTSWPRLRTRWRLWN